MSGKRKKPLIKRFFSRRIRSSGLHKALSAMVAVLGVVLLTLGLAGAPALATGGGNNGTLKIHEQGTPSGTEDNDPKVCVFNVEGFGFDAEQSGYLYFDVQGGDGPTGTPAGPFDFGPTNNDGYYATQYFNLDPGHYKATLYGKPGREDEKAKSKVFKVVCEEEPDSEGKLVVSSICESITIGMPTGVKPEGAQVVIKLDNVSVVPDTYPATPGSHTVELFVNGEKVDSETFVVEECEEEPDPEGNLVVSSTCESITFSASGVKPEDAEVIFKLDDVTKAPGTYPVTPGSSHTVDLYVGGEKVDSETVTIGLCPPPPTCPDGYQDENPEAPCYVEKPPVNRVETGTAEGCKLHGVGGVETTNTVYTTTFSFNEQTQQWVSSEAATSSSVSFTPYTKAELVTKGCVKGSPPPGNNPPPNHPTSAPHAGASSGQLGVSNYLLIGSGAAFLFAALVLFGAPRRRVGEI